MTTVYGTRFAIRLLCYTCLALPWLILPSLLALSYGGVTLLLTNVQLSYLFPTATGVVVTLVSGAFDFSAATQLIIKVLHESNHMSRFESYIALGISHTVIVTVSTFCFMPKDMFEIPDATDDQPQTPPSITADMRRRRNSLYDWSEVSIRRQSKTLKTTSEEHGQCDNDSNNGITSHTNMAMKNDENKLTRKTNTAAELPFDFELALSGNTEREVTSTCELFSKMPMIGSADVEGDGKKMCDLHERNFKKTCLKNSREVQLHRLDFSNAKRLTTNSYDIHKSADMLPIVDKSPVNDIKPYFHSQCGVYDINKDRSFIPDHVQTINSGGVFTTVINVSLRAVSSSPLTESKFDLPTCLRNEHKQNVSRSTQTTELCPVSSSTESLASASEAWTDEADSKTNDCNSVPDSNIVGNESGQNRTTAFSESLYQMKDDVKLDRQRLSVRLDLADRVWMKNCICYTKGEEREEKLSDIVLFPNLISCLLSRLYWLHVLWISFNVFRLVTFFGLINTKLTNMFSGNTNIVSFYTNVQAYFMLAIMLVCWVSGAVYDWQVSIFCGRNVEYDRRVLPGVLPLTITSVLGVAISVTWMIDNVFVLYVMFALLVFYNAFIFGICFSFLLRVFPDRYFGILNGVLSIMVGSFCFLQYGIFHWQESYDNGAQHSDIFMLVLVFTSLLHPLLIVTGRREK